jgi:hypothetical protein
MQGGSIPPLFANNLNLCGVGQPLYDYERFSI